jgi:catechol 2,3-dioxygenase-like lactoylglutathione lyase family enzyme
MTFHFDSVFYYVADLDRSIRFYRDTLGFPLRSRDVVARFDVDGVLFEIVPSAGPRVFGGEGNARFCLRVENMEEALGELKMKGVATTAAEDKDNGVLSSFHDPDGNEICLWQYGRQSGVSSR